MSRQQSTLVAQRHEDLLQRIRELKAEPPFWGYRRLWASLRCVERRTGNQQRIVRLMRAPHLLVPPHLRLKAKRTPAGSQPKPTKPNEWWGIDMTTVLGPGVGWVAIVVGLEWYPTAIVGDYAGIQCQSRDGLTALQRAVPGHFPDGARGQGLALMSDNGGQPTSLAFMQAGARLEVHQAFTSYHNPKGKADTARCIRTRKEECLWRQAWTCPCALVSALETWIDDYNEHYLHSALGYKTPRQFEREYHTSHSTPFVAA